MGAAHEFCCKNEGILEVTLKKHVVFNTFSSMHDLHAKRTLDYFKSVVRAQNACIFTWYSLSEVSWNMSRSENVDTICSGLLKVSNMSYFTLAE